MKQKQYKNLKQAGFTLIELMLVVSITIMITTVIVIDFSRQRAVRSMVLAKNETVTNLRKIQSYMLSSRNIAPGVPAKFYIAKFENNSTQIGATTNSFSVQAIDNELNFHDNLEIITLPTGVTYNSLRVAVGDGTSSVSYPCVQIIFSAPYGKTYVRGAEACDAGTTKNILSDPIALSYLTESSASLWLAINGTTGGSININPVTGQIIAN